MCNRSVVLIYTFLLVAETHKRIVFTFVGALQLNAADPATHLFTSTPERVIDNISLNQ